MGPCLEPDSGVGVPSGAWSPTRRDVRATSGLPAWRRGRHPYLGLVLSWGALC